MKERCVRVLHCGKGQRHAALKAYEYAPELFFHDEVIYDDEKTYGSIVERSRMNPVDAKGAVDESLKIIRDVFPQITNESQVGYMRGYFIVLNGFEDYPKGIHYIKEEEKDESK